MTAPQPAPGSAVSVDDERSLLDRIGEGLLLVTGATLAATVLDRPGSGPAVVSAVGDVTATAEASWPLPSATEERDLVLPFTRWLTRSAASSGGPPTVHVEPLVGSEGATIGLLGLVWSSGRAAPEDRSLAVIQTFAQAAGLAVEQARLRREAEAAQHELRGQATTDALTGLGTRILMLERLRHAATARPTSGQGMAVVFVDLDRFKDVNDLHGHTVGDEVLCTLARRLESVVRAHDTVARWGGDEFVILLHPVADEAAGVNVTRRLLEVTAEPVEVDGLELVVGASVGLAFQDPGDPAEGELLVQRADQAMFEVKHRGGNDYSVFEPADAAGARREHLRDLLRGAVSEDRVVVHYQPIIEVATERVVGVEALVRLRDDDGSLVFPAELLERGDLPLAPSFRLMEQACADVRRWVEEGHDLWLSLNVSAAQMADIDRFASDVLGVLESTGLEPRRLTLELTEHSLLSTTPRMLRGVEDLVARGVGFSIDDFGTGYGSLSYVRDLPLRELKIDQSFVHDGATRATADAVVRTLVSLAERLGLRCVAEGVENPDDLAFVRAAGVPFVQGIHWASGVDSGELTSWLRRMSARSDDERASLSS